MKTVFICIPTLYSAGAERFSTELACNLDRTRYRAIVVVTARLDENSAYYRKLRDNNIEVFLPEGSRYPQRAISLCKMLKQYKPSIVHSNIGSVLHMLLPLMLSGSRAAHLYTTHSMSGLIFSGYKKKIINVLLHRRKIIPVAICDTVRDSIGKDYHFPTEMMECVYNGVDTDRFRMKDGGDGQTFTCICVGRLQEIKNQSFLIKAFGELYRRHQNVALELVGDGELRDELVTQARQSGLEGVVNFAGRQKDIAAYLRSADIYCCTSLQEGLPISVLEAMACGLPVVTTPAGGVVDIVKDGINGFVVEPDAQKFADRLELLMLDREKRKAMGIESRRIAESHDIKVCAREYEALYDKYAQ